MLRHKETGKIEYELKIRGISQNVATHEQLTYENFRDHVLNYGQKDTLKLFQRRFMPDLEHGTVYHRILLKGYDVICPKGIIDDLDPYRSLLPLGFTYDDGFDSGFDDDDGDQDLI